MVETMKKHYDVEYRLDVNEFENSNFIEEIKTKALADKKAKELIKKFGDRLVYLEITKWEETIYGDYERIAEYEYI